MFLRLILLTAFLAFSLASVPVRAEQAVGLSIAGTSLRDMSSKERTRFSGGDEISLRVILRNYSDASVQIQRIVFWPSEGIGLQSPTDDGVDNDGNGIIDDAAEGRAQKFPDGTLMRLGGAAGRLEPGASTSYTFVVDVSNSVPLDRDAFIRLGLGTTSDETSDRRVSRVEEIVDIPISRPSLALSVLKHNRLERQDRPLARVLFRLPAGQLEETELRLSLPTALSENGGPRVRFSGDWRCENAEKPKREGRDLVWLLGRCGGNGGRLTVTLPLKVVAPSAANSAFRATLTSGALEMASAEVPITIVGAFPIARLVDSVQPELKNGEIRLRLKLRNDGQEPLMRPVISLRFDTSRSASVRCIEIERPFLTHCADRHGLMESMDVGSEREIELVARLDDKAVVDLAGLSVDLSLEDAATDETYALPRVSVALPAPAPPILSLGSKTAALSIQAGDVVPLRIEGTHPPGRHFGILRILARVVDAQTGIPEEPALLEKVIGDLSRDAEISNLTFSSELASGWARYSAPLDFSAREGMADPKPWSADIALHLGFASALRDGQVLEIAAETSAFGDVPVRSEDWIDLLLVAPSMATMMSPMDGIRTVIPGAPLSVLTLSCNLGSAPATGLAMRMITEAQLQDTEIRAGTISRDLIADAVLTPQIMEQFSAHNSDVSHTLRGTSIGTEITLRHSPRLDPDMCFGAAVTAQTDGAATPNGLRFVSALSAYRGSGVKPALFQAPAEASLVLRRAAFSLPPKSEAAIMDGGDAEHRLPITLPAILGAGSLSIDVTGSQSLPWQIAFEPPDGPSWDASAATEIAAGINGHLVIKATPSGKLSRNWLDNSVLSARFVDATGKAHVATTNLLTRRAAKGPSISIEKRIARDRDCDGSLLDETFADGLFEMVKDLASGECAILRLEFEHQGDVSLEEISIEDQLGPATSLIGESQSVLEFPEEFQTVETKHSDDRRALTWQFEGLFEPGARGTVQYAIRFGDEVAQ